MVAKIVNGARGVSFTCVIDEIPYQHRRFAPLIEA